jgi:hypothetical protein
MSVYMHRLCCSHAAIKDDTVVVAVAVVISVPPAIVRGLGSICLHTD